MPNQRLERLRGTYRQRTAGIAARLTQLEQQIHARQDVTPTQRQSMLHAARAQANQRLRDLAADLERDQATLVWKLRQGIYQAPPKALAAMDWRDALREAKRIAADHDPKDPGRPLRQARQAFAEAELAGDDAMQRALLLVAEQRGWPEIAQRYGQLHPDAGQTMGELDQIAAELADRGQQFADAAIFQMPPPTPPPPPPSLAVAFDAQASEPAAAP
jgi:hypothetical protein